MYDYKGFKSPKNGWSISLEVMEEWDKAGKLDFPTDKNKAINRKAYLDEYPGQPVSNLWTDLSVINPMSKERLNFDGQKPESLIHRVFTLTTMPGDLVLDSFLGSGTTLIAAEKSGRLARLIELDPKYADVIVRRWQEWTGKQATRDSDGALFDDQAASDSSAISQ